jgi:hypothetical protein
MTSEKRNHMYDMSYVLYIRFKGPNKLLHLPFKHVTIRY